ncbi:tRNA(Ile)-lysidine synthase [Sideroxyarcus emersonii]|uniref:tRNA(Ile)-lysidine synthase n=1 Tax=Sideroxyarcus emersonii TaxID=2764705 RepID=A0AAN1X9L1_9PROT|nr:tRNA lysidine(34) synthetase TilS [Sideroxyarcus emersonii]BCK87431.1 tRNA(Ile)-lysidine synthase [Sideroxyarcus emersonii]
MASSRKSNLADTVAARLAPLLPTRSHILVGLSGGMDSVVLLHLLHTLAARFEWRLSALHVHHGISPNADAWADFCSDLCVRYGIPLHLHHVDIAPLRDRHGIEAAARKLRHAAFAGTDCDAVALAHHADDQVETLLLQLLRGAGIKGAAAMPVFKPATRDTPATVRPLLDISRSMLHEYAHHHGLRWVEDESNVDERYPRNFLRHRLLPLLEERFPAYRETLVRSAGHFAETSSLLDELARQDAQGMALDAALDIRPLRELAAHRAKNLLRHFLQIQGAPMPHSAQLDEMLHQLLAARDDAAVCVGFGEWQLRRYQDKAYVSRSAGWFDRSLVLPWQGESELQWPALDTVIHFRDSRQQGISLAKLRRAPVTVRLRGGGESLRPGPAATTRSLKNLLQEHHVPPWRRERLPLLYSGEQLVCVVGVGIHAEYQAAAGEAGVLVSLA